MINCTRLEEGGREVPADQSNRVLEGGREGGKEEEMERGREAGRKAGREGGDEMEGGG